MATAKSSQPSTTTTNSNQTDVNYQIRYFLRMISYPLREYISSKKNDDYQQAFSKLNYSSSQTKSSSQNFICNRWIYLIIIVCLLIIYWISSSYYSYVDPTCFNNECTNFVCQGYSEGLIGGHLCPELCTSKTLQLQNCLGEHKHFRSRLFDDENGNEVIRCYLRHPLSKSNPSQDVKNHFHFPDEHSTLDTLYQAIKQHIQNLITLENADSIVEDLIKYADFNVDGKISLSEARSIWSLVQIDEFIYSILLKNKGYTPKVLGSCGHIFALEKVLHSHLPFNEKHELYSSSERPNWFQRIRIAVGIIEFFNDIWHYEDSDEHLYLCQPLINSFGYDKDYESKILKLNHLISSKSILSRLPNHCNTNNDCLYDLYCSGMCNQTTKTCQMKQFNENLLDEFCSLISSLIIPDSNQTFLNDFDLLMKQCRQIVNDGTIFISDQFHFQSLEIRQNLLLQNLRNLLWTNIEYQMNKITKKSTKKSPSSPNAIK